MFKLEKDQTEPIVDIGIKFSKNKNYTKDTGIDVTYYTCSFNGYCEHFNKCNVDFCDSKNTYKISAKIRTKKFMTLYSYSVFYLAFREKTKIVLDFLNKKGLTEKDFLIFCKQNNINSKYLFKSEEQKKDFIDSTNSLAKDIYDSKPKSKLDSDLIMKESRNKLNKLYQNIKFSTIKYDIDFNDENSNNNFNKLLNFLIKREISKVITLKNKENGQIKFSNKDKIEKNIEKYNKELVYKAGGKYIVDLNYISLILETFEIQDFPILSSHISRFEEHQFRKNIIKEGFISFLNLDEENLRTKESSDSKFGIHTKYYYTCDNIEDVEEIIQKMNSFFDFNNGIKNEEYLFKNFKVNKTIGKMFLKDNIEKIFPHINENKEIIKNIILDNFSKSFSNIEKIEDRIIKENKEIRNNKETFKKEINKSDLNYDFF